MYRRLDDFRSHFQEEITDTLKVLRAIPDSAAAQAVAQAHRDLRRLACHLVESLVSLPMEVGLKVDGPALDSSLLHTGSTPKAMSEIADLYERTAMSLLTELKAWTDADLLREDTLFGQVVWARGSTLLALELHQAHHRGQMTVLMRQAGLRVPEFYGPVLESFAAMGVPAPVV
jgi:uncharacterized damage-inducible protein DinB